MSASSANSTEELPGNEDVAMEVDVDTSAASVAPMIGPQLPPIPIPPPMPLPFVDQELGDDDDDDDPMYIPVGDDEDDEPVVIGPMAMPPRVIPARRRNSTMEADLNGYWSNFIPPSFLGASSWAGGLRSQSRGNNSVSKNLKVFSVAMLPHPRPELENGGKIILPPSLLQRLTQYIAQMNGPMLFKVTNLSTKRSIHCGVLEFIAEEGKCFMPFWRMHNIGANEGDMITVENVSAPVGKFALFEPQSVDFLDITNPTALLENALRNFACITKGEIIVLHYNDRMYQLKVLDTKPADAINIIECDIDVDFTDPVGVSKEKSSEDVEAVAEDAGASSGFVPFLGAGSRLNGKPVEEVASSAEVTRKQVRGQPDFEWKVGQLTFLRKIRKPIEPEAAPTDSFAAFTGEGVTLKGNSKPKD